MKLLSPEYYDALKICFKTKERNLELELVAKNNSRDAYRYARDIIQGRWIEAEDTIAASPYYAHLYATNVIRGKLPELMHNQMIAHGINNPNNHYVKCYMEFINKLTPAV